MNKIIVFSVDKEPNSGAIKRLNQSIQFQELTSKLKKLNLKHTIYAQRLHKLTQYEKW